MPCGTVLAATLRTFPRSGGFPYRWGGVLQWSSSFTCLLRSLLSSCAGEDRVLHLECRQYLWDRGHWPSASQRAGAHLTVKITAMQGLRGEGCCRCGRRQQVAQPWVCRRLCAAHIMHGGCRPLDLQPNILDATQQSIPLGLVCSLTAASCAIP